ncbi:Glutaredoxin-C2 [Phytophthora nicotianae]|uniref:Glutaredoxin-C2 n=1 Tax=Phytophthora nicotianae TaxID=4792 RepID=A0A0W8CXT0_PHYNI|nr:Glutaredoxin-C2 [Phytophthora nicotianae]
MKALMVVQLEKKTFLSKKNIKARYAYALQMLKFRDDDWKKVVFSDESSVWFTGAAGRIFVWRKVGEEFKNECLAPTFKSGRETLMIWGCITYEGVGALHMCDSNISGASYKSILEQNLQATVSVVGTGDDYKFVQDGAPGYRARLVKNYLKEKKVELLPHPAQSPDLNPIENLWALVKQELSKRPASSVDDLKEKIQEIWYDIEPKTVQDLYHSMPKRLLQVNDNRGGHTKY